MNLRSLSPPRKICAVLATALLLPAIAHATQTWWMRGGNWADGRDNYVDGWIIPSGMTASSTTTQAANKANQIANDIKGITNSSGRIVRMGINPQTVSSTTYWPVYCAAVDKLTASGVDVILGCWEGTTKDGKVDANWKTMWQKVATKYNGNSKIWYEPINEPFGYSTSALISLYQDYISWIGKPQDRIILAGTGYSENIGNIGGSFPNCKFGLHIYDWWATRDEAGWRNDVISRIGGYQDRTLITEMGAHATTGLNYGSSSSNNTISYIRGVTQQARNYQIGLVYWPSHRDGDSFRLFNNTTGGGVTNTSLKDRIRYGWNL